MKGQRYSKKYDAYYSSKTGEWLEEKCHDSGCEFCRNRPEKLKITPKKHKVK